jgi:hypothetical protein
VQIQRHYNGREEPPLVGRLLDDVTTGNHLRISIFREGLETTEIFQSEGALLAVFADSVRTEKEWFRVLPALDSGTNDNLDFEKEFRELGDPWPAMGDDLNEAMEILVEHQRQTGPLPLVEEMFMDPTTESITMRLPNWMVHLRCHFIDKYGEASGKKIWKRVYFRLLAEGSAKIEAG